MTRKCCVPDCESRRKRLKAEILKKSSEYITLHTFPSNEKRKRQWCSILNLKPSAVKKSSLICGVHFSPAMYHEKANAGSVKYKTLQDDAFPDMVDSDPLSVADPLPNTLLISRKKSELKKDQKKIEQRQRKTVLQKMRRLEASNNKLKDKMKALQTTEQDEQAAEELKTFYELPCGQLIQNQVNNMKKKPRGYRYNEFTKSFVVTVAQESKEAYSQVRKVFKVLPVKSTIRSMVSGQPKKRKLRKEPAEPDCHDDNSSPTEPKRVESVETPQLKVKRFADITLLDKQSDVEVNSTLSPTKKPTRKPTILETRQRKTHLQKLRRLQASKEVLKSEVKILKEKHTKVRKAADDLNTLYQSPCGKLLKEQVSSLKEKTRGYTANESTMEQQSKDAFKLVQEIIPILPTTPTMRKKTFKCKSDIEIDEPLEEVLKREMIPTPPTSPTIRTKTSICKLEIEIDVPVDDIQSEPGMYYEMLEIEPFEEPSENDETFTLTKDSFVCKSESEIVDHNIDSESDDTVGDDPDNTFDDDVSSADDFDWPVPPSESEYDEY